MATVKELTDRLKSWYGDDAIIAAPVWVEEDVIGYAREHLQMEISREQAQGILEDMHNNHDAELGITWDTIHSALEMLESKPASV